MIIQGMKPAQVVKFDTEKNNLEPRQAIKTKTQEVDVSVVDQELVKGALSKMLELPNEDSNRVMEVSESIKNGTFEFYMDELATVLVR